MGYDVFISYSHGDDDLLSERVQDALSRFAKPWYRRRALNVFRDRTGLSANPGLWSSIVDAIDNSRYFLFLASPDAAASVWCGREVSQWREKHGSEGLLVLLTDGEILWDENTNDFDWGVTTALGAPFAGAFAEEPFHIDMRWARSETQLDLTNGQFRDQIADLAAPVHGMAKDELAGEDVRQHRRAVRQAIGAGVALVLLTIAAIATSVFAVNAAGAARRSAARARHEQHVADVQFVRATKESARANANAHTAKINADQAQLNADEAKVNADHARLNADEARHQTKIANQRSRDLAVANTNLTKGGLALRKSTLLAEARLAARRSEQLMSSGDQTYQLGVLLAAEAVRHACASSAIDPTNAASASDSYPDPGCTQPGIEIDGSVASSALTSLANAGGRFVTNRLAGSSTPYLAAWSADSRRLATFSSAQSGRPEVVQVWNTDGSLAASATSDAGLTPDSSLSADGNVLALTSSATGDSGAVSAWSLSSRASISNGAIGRHPALSADGSSMAWLAPHQGKAVYIARPGASPRAITLPFIPVDVGFSADGSLVGVVVNRGGDQYSLLPIDAGTGVVGPAVDLGGFTTRKGSIWSNPPRVASGESADPPALAFATTGATAWVYNNERHVGIQLARTASAPNARVIKQRAIPTSLGGGNLGNLLTSTPDGRTVVLLNKIGALPTYQVWTLSPTGWTTAGVVPVELGATNPCQISISPNGVDLAVACLSALQIIDLQSPASTVSATIGSQGVVPPGSSVVVGPMGQTAVAWSASTLALVDTVSRSARRLPVPLGTDESFTAVGFDPGGARFVAVISHRGGCPCRIVVVDAASGNLVSGVSLGSTPLDQIAGATPVGIALDDADDVVAVTFDNNPGAPTGKAHKCGVATFSVRTGQPFQALANASLGLGEQTVSIPAFLPGTDDLALVATQGASHEVSGIVADARTGVIAHTLSMQSGLVTATGIDDGNDGYALRSSPDGKLLAWNSGGSVVIWDLGSASGASSVQSGVTLVSAAPFDPTALAISNDGEVATVGINYYGTDAAGDGTNVLLTGDELGRFLQPLGIARIAAPNQPPAQISVAMAGTGEIAAFALDVNGSRVFTDQWNASPATLLSQLCASSSRALTPSEWQTYFPGEPYQPACTATPATAWDINASPPAAQAALSSSPQPVAPAGRVLFDRDRNVDAGGLGRRRGVGDASH